jgi:hypothetical protein
MRPILARHAGKVHLAAADLKRLSIEKKILLADGEP